MPAKDQLPEMSTATKEILARVGKMVPPMLEKFHKGSFPTYLQTHVRNGRQQQPNSPLSSRHRWESTSL